MSLVAESEHLNVARERQLAIVRAMAPVERLQHALQMNRRMQELLKAGFRSRHPDWSDAQVQRAVADRILYARTG